MYNQRLMRKFMNQNMPLTKIFLERSKDSTDFGNKVLEEMFNELTPEQLVKYLNLEKPEIAHVIRETNITHIIRTTIHMFGWRSFIDDFILFAKNKEATLVGVGLAEASEAWEKISKLLANMPKSPQF